MTFAGSQLPTLDPKLLRYLQIHRGNARYLVATTTTSYASLFILDTGQAVLTLGGYQGWDRILTPAQLAHQVSSGTIRFFLLPSSGDIGANALPRQFSGGAGGRGLLSGTDARLNNINNDLLTWVRRHCTSVASSAYTTSQRGGATPGGRLTGGFDAGGAGQLYDCAAASRSHSKQK
jgi:hypothetical protein